MTQKENNNRQSQNEFVAMLQKCINAYEEADKMFDAIDDFIENTMPEKTSKFDNEQQDYLHILESYELTDDQIIAVSRKLEENRDERRNWHNIWNIAKVWKEHKNKVINKNNRVFLRETIAKTINSLNSSTWNFRVLSENQINNLLNVKSTPTTNKRGRKSSVSEEDIKEMIRLRKQKMKIVDIAKKFNMKPTSCCTIIRRNINKVA